MQAQLPESPVSGYVEYYQKTESSKDDQKTGRHIQQYVVLIRNQVPQSSQNIKSGIVKGRDRMENTDSKRMRRRVVLTEHNKTQHSSGRLKAQRK